MSCCGGKCGCGSSCGCGSGCNGCGMYPDIEKDTNTVIVVAGVAPKAVYAEEGSEMSLGAEGGNGCKCGSNCKCDPCNC